MGVNCIVYNCGANVDFRLLGRFFSGLAQTVCSASLPQAAGAWMAPFFFSL